MKNNSKKIKLNVDKLIFLRGKLSQEELGKRIGVGQSVISASENGIRGVSVDTAIKLANYYKIDVKDLFKSDFDIASDRIGKDINIKENFHLSICKRLGITTDRPIVIHKDVIEEGGELKIKSDILKDNEITLLEKFRVLSSDRQIEILASIKDKGVSDINPTSSHLPKAANH